MIISMNGSLRDLIPRIDATCGETNSTIIRFFDGKTMCTAYAVNFWRFSPAICC